MRAICLVKRLEFDFVSGGGVLSDAIAIGDVDNDGCNELIVGNISGDLVIFKGSEQWQKITGLGMICCIGVGDILNCGRNALIVIGGDGWCHIFYSPRFATQSSDLSKSDEYSTNTNESSLDKSTSSQDSQSDKNATHLERVHVQRIPANTKVILLGDIDADGNTEMVLGLTDRVVRSYRWSNKIDDSLSDLNLGQRKYNSGKLVCLNKWECGLQIGSVTLQHNVDGTPTLLIAQPGGTFMRIRCQADNPLLTSIDNVSMHSESFAASCVDYQFLGLNRMRNQSVSTEIIGDLKQKVSDTNAGSVISGNDSFAKKAKPYSVATLDGTIMLVQEETILWAIQVDHEIFVLKKLDITGDGSEEIIACSWDGQTYMLDQQKNCVRFQLDEPVQAFCCGYYSVNEDHQLLPSLVYVTFNNKIYLYYDVHLSSMVITKLSPDLSIFEQINSSDASPEEKKKERQKLVEWLLYGYHQHK